MIHSANFSILKDDPESMDKICAHVAEGGSLIDWCTAHGVRLYEVNQFIQDVDPDLVKWNLALTAQKEWAIQRILTELRSVAFPDISKIFTDDGKLKDVKDWPLDSQRALQSIVVTETETGDIKTTVKMVDKLKSIELMMKNLKMLTDRIEITQDIKVSRELVEDCSQIPADRLTDIILGRVNATKPGRASQN